MNLFRSEEHVKNWVPYDPVSADAIMPLADWAMTFSGQLFKKRMAPDYLSHVKEYAPEVMLTLQKLGRTGPFWVPRQP